MMHWGDYSWGWGMGFGGPFMVIFWLLVIVCIAYLIKRMAGGDKKDETALDILKKRYAKGEISREEYERIKDELLSNKDKL